MLAYQTIMDRWQELDAKRKEINTLVGRLQRMDANAKAIMKRDNSDPLNAAKLEFQAMLAKFEGLMRHNLPAMHQKMAVARPCSMGQFMRLFDPNKFPLTQDVFGKRILKGSNVAVASCMPHTSRGGAFEGHRFELKVGQVLETPEMPYLEAMDFEQPFYPPFYTVRYRGDSRQYKVIAYQHRLVILR